MATTALPIATERISYDDLYRRWERGNWRATEIDFTEDARQWREDLTEFERTAALWNYSLFFWGEDAVADNLSPYIDAAPLPEQKYFLATQQVDEARHAVFFKRFIHEVCGLGEGTIGSGLAAIRPQLTWGFRQVFDRLDSMADELRADRSRPKLAAAVCLYHMIVEASLAQPGQHFITSYLDDRGLLPGFRAGMHNVAADEQRHIGFGVKLLSDLIAEDERCRASVADLLREIVAPAIAVLVPPGWDERYVTVFGSTLQDVYAEGVMSLETKLRMAGLALDTLPGPPPLPYDLPPRERAQRAIDLLKGGVLGEKLGPPARDPHTVALVLDTMRRAVDPDHGLTAPLTLEWDFADLDGGFHLRVENGSTRAAMGPAEDPDLTLRCRWEDWVDVVGGRVTPPRLLLTRRLRPQGSMRALARLPKVFSGV